MSIELEGLSPKELDVLISKARQRKQKLQKRASITEVRKALAATAKKHGYTLAEIFGGASSAGGQKTGKGGRGAAGSKPRKSATKGSKVPPKYRHPASGQIWTGRGIVPKWMAAEIAQGRKREDFLI